MKRIAHPDLPVGPDCCHAAARLAHWRWCVELLLDALGKTPPALGDAREDLHRAVSVAKYLVGEE
jgi:hypothetical protein